MGWHPDNQPYQADEERVIKEGISTLRVPGKCMAKANSATSSPARLR
jgi:hypothetical protein